jgi:HD domain
LRARHREINVATRPIRAGELQAGTAPGAAQTPSVLRMLGAASRRLQLVLGDIAQGGAADARGALQQVARVVTAAFDLQPEVALASIVHNQGAGPYPVRHSIDSALVALMLARALKKTSSEVQTATLAALSMNVGMLAQHERLQRSSMALSAEDAHLIGEHPAAGVALLRAVGVTDADWLDCVLLHHKNENGSGYPGGRRDAQLPDAAKIVALADRYCARVSSRSYRAAMTPNAALRDILREGRNIMDGQLAAVFIRELGIYPIGSCVRLLNGEIGIVTRKGATSITPIVDVLVGARGTMPAAVIRRDTQNDRHAICEVLGKAHAATGLRLEQLWGPVASGW